jgi:hypothetical protein
MPLWTAVKTWIEGALTPTDLNTQLRDNTDHLHDWLGLIAHAEVTADSATFTTVATTLITLTNAPVPVGGRDVVLVVQGHVESSVAADVVSLKIKEGAAVLWDALVHCPVANKRQFFRFEVKLVAPASGNHTYILEGIRDTGTGNLKLKAAATYPAFLRAVAA